MSVCIKRLCKVDAYELTHQFVLLRPCPFQVHFQSHYSEAECQESRPQNNHRALSFCTFQQENKCAMTFGVASVPNASVCAVC